MKGTKATQLNPTLVRIGEAIRKQREKTRISQMKLGLALGTSTAAICEYENGVREMHVSRLLEIAHALNVPVSQLLEGERKRAACDSWQKRINVLPPAEQQMVYAAIECLISGAELKKAK